ncbi:MAG: DUF4339 domain-containing protein [Hyphomicrobium sp.]|jgi:hypothetical protein|nr:DUF4339 domain-containing protein [Hyphomicrobium sp.]
MISKQDHMNPTGQRMPAAEEQVWYALRPEKRSPPLRLSDLRHLAQTRLLREDDFLWHPSWETWRPASEMADLFAHAGAAPAGGGAHAGLKDRARAEMRSYLIITGYIWVILMLMHLHEAMLSGAYHFSLVKHGWAIVNALILGKVVLIAEALHMGDRLAKRMPAFAVLLKSVVFGAAIIVFHFAERVVTAWWQGQSFLGALEIVRNEGLHNSLLTAAIVSIALVPYVLIKEIEKRTGQSDLLLLAVGLKR